MAWRSSCGRVGTLAFFPTRVSAISSINTPSLVLNVSLIEATAGLDVVLSSIQLLAALIYRLKVLILEQ